MIAYFLEGLRRWSDFSGRSTRPEYWWFYLVYFLFLMVASLGMGLISYLLGSLIDVLFAIAILVSSIPVLSLSVRRLHDTGKSGWYLLLTAIPLVGFIAWIVLMVQETQPYPNKWGPVPGEDEDQDLVNSLVGDNE